jgi:hypothetical protein
MPTGSSADGEQVPPGSDGTAVEYLRELRESLRYWYTAAETKAQVVVTLNGVFLAFVTGSILANRDKAALTVTVFGPETWVFLAGMAAGVAGSVCCAVVCLMARGVGAGWPWTRRRKGEPARAGPYQAEDTVSFAALARLQPDDFADQLLSINPPFVVEASPATTSPRANTPRWRAAFATATTWISACRTWCVTAAASPTHGPSGYRARAARSDSFMDPALTGPLRDALDVL